MVGVLMTAEEAYKYEQERIASANMSVKHAGIRRHTKNGRKGYALRRSSGWKNSQFAFPNTMVWSRGILKQYGFNYWSKRDRELDAKRTGSERRKIVVKKEGHIVDSKKKVAIGSTVGYI